MAGLAICFGQDNRTPEKKKADSLEFAKFKKNYPQQFNNKRLPTKLKDDSYGISGYSTAIQISNNHIKDSVYHNFIPGMPDTSTVNPYNDIKVTDGKINIHFLPHNMLIGAPGIISSFMSQVTLSQIKDSGENFEPESGNAISVRISINGKLISDWQPLSQFKYDVYKVGSKFISPRSKDTADMYNYSQAWVICNTSIKINDQLLIEVKTNKNNWMVDRYNITRVALAPEVSAVNFLGKDKATIARNYSAELTDNKIVVQKKTLVYPPMSTK
jgi:hypothetical protein